MPSTLGPQTPLGYFRSLGSNHDVAEFWVVEDETAKWAILLSASDERWHFNAIRLDTPTSWNGVSLGKIEIVVNVESFEFSDTLSTRKGCITVASNKVFIAAAREGAWGTRIVFEVANAEKCETTAAAVFYNWQLIQRRFDGSPNILFEKKS
ncbi:hypothetical protein [Sandarakinorhabdus sp. DWP1-3-1]|uniref:hypothetical protein n=1 Tax=Sandarakinorhabdus sp. DWP1-3-1 TaxID=2804627 RepID=UPI003CF0F0D1